MLVCTVQTCLENMVGCLGSIAMIAVLIPWFLLSVPPFVLILFYLQRRYVVVSRELKRLDGVSRSPMYAHFSQTLQVCLPCVSFCKRQNFYFHSFMKIFSCAQIPATLHHLYFQHVSCIFEAPSTSLLSCNPWSI